MAGGGSRSLVSSHAPASAIIDSLDAPIRRVVDREDLELVAWEWPGTSPPALLLHGIGNYGRYWDRVARAIDGRLRLVAPDARGHGESAKPAGGYTAGHFVDDALAVVDSVIGAETPVVVGHSMGGGHARALANAHPARVRGLVLVDISVGESSLGERARRLAENRPPSFENEAAALTWLRATSPGYDDGVYEERLSWLFDRGSGRLVWRSSRDALRRIMGAPGRSRRDGPGIVVAPKRSAATPRAEVPLLLVRGTRSPALPREVAAAIIAASLRASLLELDAGHNVPLERAADLAEAIVAFAQACP